jgi:hypothetical protein
MLSNANHDAIHALYQAGYRIVEVKANRIINSGQPKGPDPEVIVRTTVSSLNRSISPKRIAADSFCVFQKPYLVFCTVNVASKRLKKPESHEFCLDILTGGHVMKLKLPDRRESILLVA